LLIHWTSQLSSPTPCQEHSAAGGATRGRGTHFFTGARARSPGRLSMDGAIAAACLWLLGQGATRLFRNDARHRMPPLHWGASPMAVALQPKRGRAAGLRGRSAAGRGGGGQACCPRGRLYLTCFGALARSTAGSSWSCRRDHGPLHPRACCPTTPATRPPPFLVVRAPADGPRPRVSGARRKRGRPTRCVPPSAPRAVSGGAQCHCERGDDGAPRVRPRGGRGFPRCAAGAPSRLRGDQRAAVPFASRGGRVPSRRPL